MDRIGSGVFVERKESSWIARPNDTRAGTSSGDVFRGAGGDEIEAAVESSHFWRAFLNGVVRARQRDYFAGESKGVGGVWRQDHNGTLPGQYCMIGL